MGGPFNRDGSAAPAIRPAPSRINHFREHVIGRKETPTVHLNNRLYEGEDRRMRQMLRDAARPQRRAHMCGSIRSRARSIACRFLLGAAFGVLPGTVAIADKDAFLPDQITTSTVPANGDQNPYGVAIVPEDFPGGGKVKPGDVLVSNFNNAGSPPTGNQQGTGSTIVSFAPSGEAVAANGEAATFFQGNPGLGLTTALGVLRRGFVVAGNLPATNGALVSPLSSQPPGSLIFLDRNGNQVKPLSPLTDPHIEGPWDLTIFDQFDHAKLFVSNVLNGTVTRIDLLVGTTNITISQITTIATGYTVQPNSAALILGPTGLAYDADRDVLYIASTADNEVFAVPQAGARKTAVAKGSVVFSDPHLRGPLALAFAPNGDLLTANGDAVNADPTQPSEIVEFTRKGEFVGQFNVDAAQGGAFGLAVSVRRSSARFAYIDDVNNTLTVLDRPVNP
jgi:hypothetical protein